jgi:hypothetical protein
LLVAVLAPRANPFVELVAEVSGLSEVRYQVAIDDRDVGLDVRRM